MSIDTYTSGLLKTENVLKTAGRFLNDEDIAQCLLTMQLHLVRVFDPRQTQLISRNPVRFSEDTSKRNSRYSVLNIGATAAVSSCCSDVIAFIVHAENHYSVLVLSMWASIQSNALVAAHFDSLPSSGTRHREVCTNLLKKLIKLPEFAWAKSIDFHPFNHSQRLTNCGISALSVIAAIDTILCVSPVFSDFFELCTDVYENVLKNDVAVASVRNDFRTKFVALRTCVTAFSRGSQTMPLHGLSSNAGTICAGDVISVLMRADVELPLLKFALETHFGHSAVFVCTSVAALIAFAKTDQANTKIAMLALLDTENTVLLLRSYITRWTLLVPNDSNEIQFGVALHTQLSNALTGRYNVEMPFFPITHCAPDKSCCRVHSGVSRAVRVLESLRWHLKHHPEACDVAVAALLSELHADAHWLCAGPLVQARATRKHTTRVVNICEQIAVQLCFMHYDAVQASSSSTVVVLPQPPPPKQQPLPVSSLMQTTPIQVTQSMSSLRLENNNRDEISALVKKRDEAIDSLLEKLEQLSVYNNSRETALEQYTQFCSADRLRSVERDTKTMWQLVCSNESFKNSVQFYGVGAATVLATQWAMCYAYEKPAEFSFGLGAQHKVTGNLFVSAPSNQQQIEHLLYMVSQDALPVPLFYPVVIYALVTPSNNDCATATSAAAADVAVVAPSPIEDDVQDMSADYASYFFSSANLHVSATAQAMNKIQTARDAPSSISQKSSQCNARKPLYELVDMVGVQEALLLVERHGATVYEHSQQYCSSAHLPLNFIPCLSRTPDSSRRSELSSMYSSKQVPRVCDKRQYDAIKRQLIATMCFSDSLLPAVFLNVTRDKL